MILIVDDILQREELQLIRASALQAGIGTWRPPTHQFGAGEYEGMGFKGSMGPLHASITRVMGRPIYPNSSFFRVTGESTESLVHSDRMDGDFTAIAYLSEHDHERHGTAFYSHKETNLREMPTVESMSEENTTQYWNEQMQDKTNFEETDFVRGLLGRLLIFRAPLFHGRVDLLKSGSELTDKRMIFVSHFMV